MKWVSVKERLPEDDQTVFCWHDKRTAALPMICYYDEDDKCFYALFCDQEVQAVVTHWQPLPYPPREE